MDKNIEAFTENLEKYGLVQEDVKRSLKYANDLGRGLKILRTFSQGVTVFGSARVPEDHKYYKKARELGQQLASNGHAVITGGGPGIMEAANRGAFEYGGRSVGLNITLDHEQFPNPYLTDTMEFHYFFSRKVMLVMASKVFAFFPGGFGTLDELSEVMILEQEDKMPKQPIFLVGKSYWKPLYKVWEKKLLAEGMIKKKDLKLVTITDDINEIVKAANKQGHVKVDENIYDDYFVNKKKNN
ncbi:TIGR00730 family Rossman fold protein [Candidatus Saccharibacteria bacterium]|nr:TIGR00730 family Rossman fold protein [Candidatus Saccharibacteria bacterium]